MLKIGITGGIGSGKSTVCKIFECLGFPVFYADQRARWLTENSPGIMSSIANEFGANYITEGAVNRAKLADLVFSDLNMLEKLNNIIHPFVKQDYERWISQQNYLATISEAAIYFESGRYKDFDKMILVTSPEELKISRLEKRNGLKEKEIRNRMSTQWSDEKKIPLADYVIVNDEKQGLIEQVVRLSEELRCSV